MRKLSATGGNRSDIVSVLEKHLQQHPDCPKHKEIIGLLAQLAVDGKDHQRQLKYGPEAIENGSRDPHLLQFVTRELLDRDDAQSKALALKYALLLIPLLRTEIKTRLAATVYEPGQGKRLDEAEFALKEALVYEARALDRLDRNEEALKPAVEAWEIQPSLDAALERARGAGAPGPLFGSPRCDGRGIRRRGRTRRERGTAARPRAHGRAGRQGQCQRCVVRVLPAWDRTRPLAEARHLRLRNFDPNNAAMSPLEFTLTRLEGGQLAMSSLKGKVVVLDFLGHLVRTVPRPAPAV